MNRKLSEEGKALIDIALDNKDYSWCKEIFDKYIEDEGISKREEDYIKNIDDILEERFSAIQRKLDSFNNK